MMGVNDVGLNNKSERGLRKLLRSVMVITIDEAHQTSLEHYNVTLVLMTDEICSSPVALNHILNRFMFKTLF